jgi:hypothetical protein
VNGNQADKLGPPADRNRVPSAGDTENPDELKDELEKYEHREELAELFFTAKRHHPQVRAKKSG